MKFVPVRNLTDKVFSTKIICEGFGDQELSEDEEKSLIEDFGPISISTGGEYKGLIEKDSKTNEITVDIKTAIDESNKDKSIKFIVNAVKVDVKPGMEISYNIDVKKIKENSTKFSNIEIAEARCKIFEKVILEKLTEAIVAFKSQKTTFENEKLETTII